MDGVDSVPNHDPVGVGRVDSVPDHGPVGVGRVDSVPDHGPVSVGGMDALTNGVGAQGRMSRRSPPTTLVKTNTCSAEMCPHPPDLNPTSARTPAQYPFPQTGSSWSRILRPSIHTFAIPSSENRQLVVPHPPSLTAHLHNALLRKQAARRADRVVLQRDGRFWAYVHGVHIRVPGIPRAQARVLVPARREGKLHPAVENGMPVVVLALCECEHRHAAAELRVLDRLTRHHLHIGFPGTEGRQCMELWCVRSSAHEGLSAWGLQCMELWCVRASAHEGLSAWGLQCMGSSVHEASMHAGLRTQRSCVDGLLQTKRRV
eukprot:365450-Chlamydomonas_euryale.AAC.3